MTRNRAHTNFPVGQVPHHMRLKDYGLVETATAGTKERDSEESDCEHPLPVLVIAISMPTARVMPDFSLFIVSQSAFRSPNNGRRLDALSSGYSAFRSPDGRTDGAAAVVARRAHAEEEGKSSSAAVPSLDEDALCSRPACSVARRSLSHLTAGSNTSHRP